MKKGRVEELGGKGWSRGTGRRRVERVAPRTNQGEMYKVSSTLIQSRVSLYNSKILKHPELSYFILLYFTLRLKTYVNKKYKREKAKKSYIE